MNILSKVICIVGLLCIDFCNVLSKTNKTPEEEATKELIEKSKKLKTEDERAQYLFDNIDQQRVSKNICGANDEKVAKATSRYAARMMGAKSVMDILMADDCSTEITNIVKKPNKYEVRVKITATTSNKVQKSVLMIVIMSKNLKLIDMYIEELSIIQALVTQIQSYVKNKYKKSLKQISSGERPKIVVEAIDYILGSTGENPAAGATSTGKKGGN
jgi:hypothetical protein